MDLTVGERIVAARKRAKINRETLAIGVGVSVSALAQVETGRMSPRLELIEAIAIRLGVSASDLIL